MIQPLRSAHRRIFCAIAIVVPFVFLAGLVDREPQSATATSTTRDVAANAVRWSSGLIATETVKRDGDFSLIVHIVQPLHAPDPLFYCSAEAVPATHLPADAVLLGPAQDNAWFTLPCRRGHLILYSLGHQKVIDQIAFEVKP
jgi:hypothetical protein